MAHYAELNENNEVIYVVYMDNEIIIDENGDEIEQRGIDHLHLHNGENRRWIRTSYGSNFRRKFAGIGDIYNEDIDMFISSRPYESWSLNINNGDWEPPIPLPDLTEQQQNDRYYYEWNEELYQTDNTQGWILTQIQISQSETTES